MTLPSLGVFLAKCNDGKRVRTFDKGDYSLLRCAFEEAERSAKKREPYYRAFNAGGVAKNYGYPATTARCGVFTTTDGSIRVVFDRVRVSGRAVPCIFPGGERSYLRDFKSRLHKYWFPKGATA